MLVGEGYVVYDYLDGSDKRSDGNSEINNGRDGNGMIDGKEELASGSGEVGIVSCGRIDLRWALRMGQLQISNSE